MERSILHVDLDSFFVSVERLKDTRLINKPVIIGGTSDRGVVASCSYETRQFGVRSAMPIAIAKQLCPEAIIVGPDMDAYTKYSELVTEIIKTESPLFEKASIDEFYLDISGMDRFFGCYQWAKMLKNTIVSESGVPISFGLSVNKLISKISTGEVKPDGQKKIPKGMEKAFLSPLPVAKIPMVGPKHALLLRRMGVFKIATLQQMPVQMLQAVFGNTGAVLWNKAQGKDDSPVVPYTQRKSISTENTFDKDTIDVIWLKAILVGMVEKLSFQLRESQKLTACVTVKVRYSDFDTRTIQSKISYTSADHILINKVKELFNKLYQKRLLVRLIGIRFSDLVHGNYQLHAFDDTSASSHLYQAMDAIRHKYGKAAIRRAIAVSARSSIG